MKQTRYASLAAAFLALTCLAQDELPAGKGKETVEKMCSACHGLEVITGQRLSRTAWASMVDQMVGRGAIGTDEELAEVTAYLAEHFARQVNVNKASVNELQAGLSLTKSEAEAIVKARSARPFKDIGDLKAVPGLDAAKLEQLKGSILF